MKATALKKRRLKMGLTQTQLGVRLGVSRKTVLNYESGITAIPDTKAQLLRLIFNIKPRRKAGEAPVIKIKKKTPRELLTDDFVERMIPFFSALEVSVTEIKCELEAVKLYMKIGEEIDGE